MTRNRWGDTQPAPPLHRLYSKKPSAWIKIARFVRLLLTFYGVVSLLILFHLSDDAPNFTASQAWLDRWNKLYSIHQFTVIGGSLSCVVNISDKFKRVEKHEAKRTASSYERFCLNLVPHLTTNQSRQRLTLITYWVG